MIQNTHALRLGRNAERCWAVRTQSIVTQIPCMGMRAGCGRAMSMETSMAQEHMQVTTTSVRVGNPSRLGAYRTEGSRSLHYH